MADLDTYEDKVIVFEAVKASDASRVVTRQPLQPTNTQLLSPKGSLHKSTRIKPSFDSASDENHIPPPSTSYGSLHSSRGMHGQALHPGTRSNIHSPPPSSGRMSQASRSNSHTPGSTFRSSTLSHSSVGSRINPHIGATTPASTSDRAVGSVDMAGFDRYYASWRDRIQVSYPDYDDGTHALVSSTLSTINSCL